LNSTPLSPAEHVGPGRGEQGSEFTAQEGDDSVTEAGAPSAAGNALVSVDTALRETVTERLVEELDVDPEDLRVEVEEGTVALTGDVDDPAVPERAEQIAAAVSGVQSVTNRIRVRRGEDEG
jgi:osmotically-inducible protein OsmY